MKHLFTITLSLLVGTGLFAQFSTGKRFQEIEQGNLATSAGASYEENFSNPDLERKIKDYYESHALIFPKGVYVGYAAVHSEIKLPKGYAFFISFDAWENFLAQQEPELISNLKKYGGLSEESKHLYRNSYEKKLAAFDTEEAAMGMYPFERIVLEEYLRKLGSDKVSYTNENQISEIEVYEESFEVEEWYALVEKYQFRKEVEETIELKDSDNIDQIVELQEKLVREDKEIWEYIEYLDERRYLTQVANTPVVKEEVKSLEQYDADVAQTLKDFPGVFTDEERLKRDRLNHMKKLLDAETNFVSAKEEQEEAKRRLLVKKEPMEDLRFKMARVKALSDILLNRKVDNRASYMAKKTVMTPTILDEWYMNTGAPKALLMIDEEWIPVGEASSKEILTHELKKLEVQLIPWPTEGSGDLTEIAYYSTDRDYVYVNIISLDGYWAVVEVLGPNPSNFSNRPVIEGSVTLNVGQELVEIFVPKAEITAQVTAIHNDYLALKKSRQNGGNAVQLLFPSSTSLVPSYLAEPKTLDPNLTAETVFDRYIEAIGGKAAVERIRVVQTTAETEIQGQEILKVAIKTTAGQSSDLFSLDGKVFQRRIFNGKDGFMEGQGRKSTYSREQIATAKLEAHPFPELNITGATLEGVESLKGEEVYVVSIDENTKNYYSVENGLKVQSVTTITQGGQRIPVPTVLSDYRDVEGVKFPFRISQTAGGQSVQFKVLDIEINTEVSSSDFN